jgi:hypothetical protein
VDWVELFHLQPGLGFVSSGMLDSVVYRGQGRVLGVAWRPDLLDEKDRMGSNERSDSVGQSFPNQASSVFRQ